MVTSFIYWHWGFIHYATLPQYYLRQQVVRPTEVLGGCG